MKKLGAGLIALGMSTSTLGTYLTYDETENPFYGGMVCFAGVLATVAGACFVLFDKPSAIENRVEQQPNDVEQQLNVLPRAHRGQMLENNIPHMVMYFARANNVLFVNGQERQV